MAIVSIGVEGTSAERKPFIEDYLDSLSRADTKKLANAVFEVQMLSFGRKGLIIQTEFFCVFVWKKSELYGYLEEACDVWALGQPCHSLVVVIDDPTDGTYHLGLNDSVMTSWDSQKKGKKLVNSSIVNDTEQSRLPNPFLPPTKLSKV